MNIKYESIIKIIDEYLETVKDQENTTLLLSDIKQEIDALMYVTQSKRIGMFK